MMLLRLRLFGLSRFGMSFFHFWGLGLRVFVLYMGVEGRIGTVGLAARVGAEILFCDVGVLAPVNFLVHYLLFIIDPPKGIGLI